MNIIYKLQIGKKSNQLLIRLFKGRFDVSCSVGLSFNESDWNYDLQLAKNNNLVNEKLLELKSEVLKKYNQEIVQGVIFNKKWLQSIVSDVFNRPSNEVGICSKEHFIYLSDFANWWIENKSFDWKTGPRTTFNKKQKSQYQNLIDLLIEFEKDRKEKLVMKDLSVNDIYEFINYLEDLDYSASTINRYIGRLKFFCLRAFENEIKISNSFRQRIYIEKEDEFDGIYLNEGEIQKIYETDFSFDPNLQTAKENLLIGAFSALRVSDYLTNLDLSNIKDDFITIITQKTKTKVVVPVHKIIKEIIASNFGNLPMKMTQYEFGKNIKIIGQLCGFDNLVYGKKWNPETKRKEKGYFKRYELFTTHIARRSAATNLYGKVSNDVILSIMGWKDLSMLQHYIQTSKKENAEKLRDFWENKE